ncbi:MAG: hypothetical protein ACFFCI_06095 [Promethearchaeota archaeon]
MNETDFLNLSQLIKKDEIDKVNNTTIQRLYNLYFNQYMKNISIESGYTLDTLTKLIIKLVDNIDPNLLYEENYEINQRKALEKQGLNFHDLKYEFVALRKAFFQLIALLIDANHIESYWINLMKDFWFLDETLLLKNPIKKPDLIRESQFDKYNIKSTFYDNLEDLLNQYYLDEHDGQWILAEFTLIRILCKSVAQEVREKIPYYLNHPHHEFSRVRNVKLEEYSHAPIPLQEGLVIQNHPAWNEMPQANWIALNPTVGKFHDWQVSKEGLFRWIDEKGNLMVETIWWNEGNPQKLGVYFCAVGEGWIVKASKDGMEQLKTLGEIKAIHSLSRGIFQRDRSPEIQRASKTHYL